MPALDANIDSFNLPWSVEGILAAPLGAGNSLGILWSGYPTIALKEHRFTSARNTPLQKPNRSAFRTALAEWYVEKPKRSINFEDFTRSEKRLFRTAKADWRRRRPVKTKLNSIPDGWKQVKLPSGKYELVSTGRFGRAGLRTYAWAPTFVTRLRPITGRQRADGRLPLLAKVNDLYYFKQSGWCYGYGVFTVAPTPDGNWEGPSTLHPNGTNVGYLEMTGDPRFFPWASMGFPYNPIRDNHSFVDPATLADDYAVEISDLEKIALSRLYSKLKNQKVDLATELSQGALTVNLIGDLAKRVGGALLLAKKFDIIGACKLLFPTSRKEVANDYLMWQYGIKPLLGDIVGAAEHLAEFISKSAPVKCNGHAKKTVRKQDDSIILHENRSVFREASIRVKYGAHYSISSELSRQASQLGVTNPANVIWELVPFSFVADWFLPIGDFLQNLTALNGLKVTECYKTVFITEKRYDTFNINDNLNSPGRCMPYYPAFSFGSSGVNGNAGYLKFEGGQSFVYRETIYCKREVISLPGMPDLHFKNPISPVHIANAVALFTQLKLSK